MPAPLPEPKTYTRPFFTSDDEILRIGHALRDRTLPKPEWTHAAHFAAALWLVASEPQTDAMQVMPRLIRAYNQATGTANTATSGYHETITRASLRAARAFLHHSGAQPLFVICNRLLSSELGRSHWLLAYWTRDRLFSAEARRQWTEPDLKPFPF